MKTFRFCVEFYEDINSDNKPCYYSGFVFAKDYTEAVSKICNFIDTDVIEIRIYEYEGYSMGIILDSDIEDTINEENPMPGIWL